MRRLFLIVMMCLLPLQFGWAAVAAVSAHALQADPQVHIGHHDGHHDGHHEQTHDHEVASTSAASSDTGTPDAATDGHDDGSTCHSHGHSHGSDVMSAAWILGVNAAGSCFADHRLRHVPDPTPDELLRPPLAHLA